MIPHPPHPPEDGGVDAWLMSYADMITLLLCFFIIYVSTSEPKQERLAAATKGFQQYFGTFKMDSPYDGVYRELQGTIATNSADQNISVEKSPKGIQIEMSALRCFAGDTAEISPDHLPVLTALAQQLKRAELGRYEIVVEGYTDDAPPNMALFPSNWELAGARATRIVRFLNDQGLPPDHLRAVSFAETKPLVPNEDAGGHPIIENRLRNHRVVIRVEKLD